MLGKFGQNVLLLALEFHLLNAGFLLAFRCENLGKKTLLSVGLWARGDDFNDTLSDFLFQPVVLDEHVLVEFLEVADFQSGVGELVGRGIVNTSAKQCKIGVLLCHPIPPDKLRRADTPKKSLSPRRSTVQPLLRVQASSSQEAKSTPNSAHSSNSKVSGRRSMRGSFCIAV